MKLRLFQHTSIRLAGTYLSVLMVLSMVFSVAIFRLSGHEFDQNFNRANEFANRFVGFRIDPAARDTYLADRADERTQGKSHLVGQLVFLNFIILVLGGGVCYVLARRTLEPIEQAHTSLERFTSDAAHELRTPLTSMRTEIEVAMMKPKLSIAEANAATKQPRRSKQADRTER